MTDEKDITRMLHEVESGQEGALDRLMEAVYRDLERVAERKLTEQYGRGLPGVTLEPAALVNESFLKLLKQRKGFLNRGQFFAVATRIMTRLLKDTEAGRVAAKRGGGGKPVTLCLDELRPGDPGGRESAGVDLESCTRAIDALAELDSRKADVVRLRVFWGLTMPEIAEAVEASLATVERDWSFARAWLSREMSDADRPHPQDRPEDRNDEGVP